MFRKFKNALWSAFDNGFVDQSRRAVVPTKTGNLAVIFDWHPAPSITLVVMNYKAQRTQQCTLSEDAYRTLKTLLDDVERGPLEEEEASDA